MKGTTCFLTGLVVVGLALPSGSQGMEAAPGLDGLCDRVEFDVRAGVFDVGGIQAWRGPLEFEGARIIGCLRNNSDEEITELSLVYDNVQTKGGGGGSGTISLQPLAPGAIGLFMSSAFHQDTERLERFGTTGIRLRELQIPRGWEERTERDGSVSMVMAHDSHAFEPRIELDYPLLDLPENELTAACAAAVSTGGEVTVSEVQVAQFPDGKYRLVGCLSNGSDRTQADGFSHQVSVSYSVRSAGMAGGWGNLRLTGELPSGQSAVFVSGFELAGPDAEVTLTFN